MKINDQQRILNAQSTMDPFITDPTKDSKKHPSFLVFVKELETHIGADAAAALWKLLLEGFQEIKSAPDPADARYHTKFNAFAKEAACKNLLDTKGEELALWSGGFDMSIIAQNLGHCTLEKTILGRLLDTTEITSLWNLEAKLWNAISKEFVDSYHGTVAHIYFRTVDEASVLLRQEVPALEGKIPKVHIFWHPIYRNGLKSGGVCTQYSEVGILNNAINIDSKNRGFECKEKACEALQEKLRVTGLKDKRAIEAANSPLFQPNRAPFALYG